MYIYILYFHFILLIYTLEPFLLCINELKASVRSAAALERCRLDETVQLVRYLFAVLPQLTSNSFEPGQRFVARHSRQRLGSAPAEMDESNI